MSAQSRNVKRKKLFLLLGNPSFQACTDCVSCQRTPGKLLFLYILFHFELILFLSISYVIGFFLLNPLKCFPFISDCFSKLISIPKFSPSKFDLDIYPHILFYRSNHHFIVFAMCSVDK